MDKAKASAINIAREDVQNFHQEYLDIVATIKRKAQEVVDEAKEFLAQIPQAKSGALIPKTPKPARMRIESIPENEVVNQSTVKTHLNIIRNELLIKEEIIPTRSKRAASIKANDTIKKQQSMSLNTKLRRPSVTEEIKVGAKPIRPSRSKRPKVSNSESEDESSRPTKQSKIDNVSTKHVTKPTIKLEPMSELSSDTSPDEPDEPIQRSMSLRHKESEKSMEKLQCPSINIETPKESHSNIVNETLTEHDVTLTEQSMYEDAIGKSIPMNSTMNPNTTVTIDRKVLNVTVVLEKMNETRSINKSSMSTRSTTSTKQSLPIIPDHPLNEEIETQSDLTVKNAMKNIQNSTYSINIMNNDINELITDDESSPDRVKEKTLKNIEKLPVKKRKRIHENITEDSDDDVVMASPMQSLLKAPSTVKRKDKVQYKKPNALFSPYAKDSVKKRVEAFEQVRLTNPTETSGRITRTKTRAMAAKADESVKTPSVATTLARKSLARAKKISLAKQKRDNEEEKENNSNDSTQNSKILPPKNDKFSYKQQQRTTPIGKSRLQMPMSVSRIPHTPIGSQLLPPSKAMTTSRTHNIASSTESLAPLKPISKSGSTDSLTEKKIKLINTNEEDARRKKEEALKAQTEEKRRKREEKELKNKLAREAKEKLEQEKRLKQEKEREEKARHAMIMQEKMREEAEKKRLAQLQRIQEKEERRKQEEQLKLQRLQEQEETERLLAEQKRREQEAERRKMAETRAQQLAVAEAARLKQQYQAKAKLLQQQKQQQMQTAPTSYKIDSEPDDDESDNESKPKYPIPFWAKSEVRKRQLEMQQYVPMDSVLAFFGAKKTTPDLSELFSGIKKERLKRTSSAIWKTPPRFSMMDDE